MKPALTVLVITITLFASGAAAAQCVKKGAPADPSTKYFGNFPYRTKILTEDDQVLLTVDGIDEGGDYPTYARAVIFGRHGREFRTPKIRAWLSQEKWYKPNPKFSNSMLNDTERKNLDIVRKLEADQHAEVQPGDLRFWKDKDIPKQKMNLSRVALHVMRAEIEAIHGKRFDDEPWIQSYFEARYWYKPAAHYDPKSLNAHEKANMALMAKEESKLIGTSLMPGDLLAYGEKPIKPELISKSNLYDLRLLRNEIYAIHGARFHTPWIQDHFDQQDWYAPLPKGKTPQLSRIDEQNVAVILKKENELHLALSKSKLTEDDLNGMMSDDAARLRDEIYARRGKVFKNKWLQGYFASLPWYKASSKYSDKSLNSVERANIKILAKYEKQAREQEDMTEG